MTSSAPSDEAGDDQFELQFELQVDDGWPPVSVEPVWATKLSDSTAQLENAPFFAVGAARLDTVRIERSEAGPWRFVSVEQPSGHSVVRVIAADAADLPAIIDAMVQLGCAYEASFIETLVAFDVLPDSEFGPIRAFLDNAENQGRLDYDEGSIAPQHAEQGAVSLH